MAPGRTKDGLCITGVYSPHPSNSPPRCLRDESQFLLLREGELFASAFCIYFDLDDLHCFGKSQMSSFLENAIRQKGFILVTQTNPQYNKKGDQAIHTLPQISQRG
jgi:hypothetical protein